MFARIAFNLSIFGHTSYLPPSITMRTNHVISWRVGNALSDFLDGTSREPMVGLETVLEIECSEGVADGATVPSVAFTLDIGVN